MTPILCRRLSILLGITIVVTFLASFRLSRQRTWFPSAPLSIGDWAATEVPLDRTTLEMLGSPPADGYRFTNPFGERVECNVISTESYQAYREPLICMPGYGFTKTAYKTMSFLGPNCPVRAMILKNQSDGQRVLMYYWVQYKDGSLGTQSELPLHQDFVPRFTVGWDKTLHIEPSCVVRTYIVIHPSDHLGLQARRSLDEVCKGLYESLKKDGTHS